MFGLGCIKINSGAKKIYTYRDRSVKTVFANTIKTELGKLFNESRSGVECLDIKRGYVGIVRMICETEIDLIIIDSIINFPE